MSPLPAEANVVKRAKSTPGQEAVLALPPGTPAWITPQLVERTLRVWQPFYARPLELADALHLLTTVDHLMGLCIAGRRPGS